MSIRARVFTMEFLGRAPADSDARPIECQRMQGTRLPRFASIHCNAEVVPDSRARGFLANALGLFQVRLEFADGSGRLSAVTSASDTIGL
ncbi:hypothetical protein R1flu_028413 [Riccia fluitans]|uniref:Uncharacterized protein n=1 Tax=Riccia fluitans TaxID=41844 RepID=A0ABD1XLP3_9MARC